MHHKKPAECLLNPTILAASATAKKKVSGELQVSGDGGKMLEVCDAIIAVPSLVTARTQEMHIMIGHMLCKALEQRLDFV